MTGGYLLAKPYGSTMLAFLTLIATVTAGASNTSQHPPAAQVITPEQIQADWLRQDELRNADSLKKANKPTPQQDAIGACDGIKDGQWGFHTQNENNPWWRIDLGQSMPLDRMVLYNRTDLAERASRLIVSLSDDDKDFKQIYQHDGTAFFGYSDKKPLLIKLAGAKARYVRLQLPGKSYFHLDEVEIYTLGANQNIALGKPATQSSVSQWSVAHTIVPPAPSSYPTSKVIDRGLRLAANLSNSGPEIDAQEKKLKRLAQRLNDLAANAPDQIQRNLHFQARWVVRKMALANPLLDFDTILFVKRSPGMFPHVCDQYYGWWSRPGGGIHLLKGFKGETPRLQCLTEDWPEGNFLRPDLSCDAKKILFAWCRYYPHVSAVKNKVEKEKLPEDAFYHIFEMNIDGAACRQLTHGRYDDFDARYLPGGEIAFLSTRKGTWLQTTKAGSAETLKTTCPDSYVRCGGGNHRPVAVFTLHLMNANGKNLRPISAFENFEWTPAVASDGRIIYARWDYIDRFNGHFMSLWSTNTDGTNPQLVYGNYTKKPQCIFEARPIPNSQKLIFTATAHHSITGGSLVLFDRNRGIEYEDALTRLTPEVCFPEAEGWPNSYYSGPYPLSEQHFLVAWSDRKLPAHRLMKIDDPANPTNAAGLYIYDAFGNLNLLYRDPDISSMNPIPVRTRKSPPPRSHNVAWDGPQEGSFLLQDVYRGLAGIDPGSIKRLRIIGVPPKTQPQMNSPSLGVSREDPGKFILGTVPVEHDGSAYFRVPSGVSIFFQALNAKGIALQTMRSLTYVQPGQTLSCIGCHESRELAPPAGPRPLAALRPPSKITPGPSGTWPLRFDRLVQPVLDKSCISCHKPGSPDKEAAALDLTGPNSYQALLTFADKDLEKLAFEKDVSAVGQCPAQKSKLLAILTDKQGHQGIRLPPESLDRLITWMDTYAQKLGAFSDHQEHQLKNLRKKMAHLLTD